MTNLSPSQSQAASTLTQASATNNAAIGALADALPGSDVVVDANATAL